MAKKIQYLVIHCTDTPAGREVSAADIRDWHLSPAPRGRGWRQVGYTDLVHLDGRITRLIDNNEDGAVDTWEISNGVAGINNVSRHIVYSGGGKGVDTRTAAQRFALEAYVLDFVARFPWVKVGGHTQFDRGKPCPSFDVRRWLIEIGVAEVNIY